MLAHLRNGDTRDRLAGGFDISATTVWRYIREAVDLLTAAAPTRPGDAAHRLRQVARPLDALLWVLASNGDGPGSLGSDGDRILRLTP